MKKSNSAALRFGIGSAACFGIAFLFGHYALKKAHDRTEEWHFGLSSRYVLANKRPDWSYFFPSAFSLKDSYIEVSIDDLRLFAARSDENTIVIVAEHGITAHYISRGPNGLIYYATDQPPGDNSGLDASRTFIRNDSTLVAYYAYPAAARRLQVIILVLMGIAGIVFGAEAIMHVRSRPQQKIGVSGSAPAPQ